jgi:stress response protein YsnF
MLMSKLIKPKSIERVIVEKERKDKKEVVIGKWCQDCSRMMKVSAEEKKRLMIGKLAVK